MDLYVEDDSHMELPIPYEEIAVKVIEYALDYEKCPYDTEVNLLLSNNDEIALINEEQRGISKPTDVLSFPMVDYQVPADFSELENHIVEYFNPETGQLILGDIIISLEKVCEQAKSYGHSLEREFAFLVAHSILHLMGYDHMDEEETRVMEAKQREILENLGIAR
jgi:probable rRNA maturation factor